MSKHETPTQLLDCGNDHVVNDTWPAIRNCQAFACLSRTNSAFSVRIASGVEEDRRCRVHTSEESKMANRLRIMLSRQLQSMGIPASRRASLRDRRAGTDRDIRSFWRLAREAVANNV